MTIGTQMPWHLDMNDFIVTLQHDECNVWLMYSTNLLARWSLAMDMNSTRAMRHRKWTSLIYLNKPAFWFSLPASWAIVIQCYSLLWCQGIAQGMLQKLIHPSYKIFIVVFLINDCHEPSSVNFGFRKKNAEPSTSNSILPQVPGMSARTKASFSGPRCPPDPPDAWFMLSPMSWPGVLSGTVAIGLPKLQFNIFPNAESLWKIWELFHQHMNFGHSWKYLDVRGTDSTKWEGCSTEGTNIKSSSTASLNVFGDSGMIWCWWVANHTFLSCPLAVWSTLCLAYLVSGLVTWGSTYC